MPDFGKYSENLPKGYTQATDPGKSCLTCGAFQSGYCKMYYVPVEADYTCDEWVKTFTSEG